jgi:hypothetical protein
MELDRAPLAIAAASATCVDLDARVGESRRDRVGAPAVVIARRRS